MTQTVQVQLLTKLLQQKLIMPTEVTEHSQHPKVVQTIVHSQVWLQQTTETMMKWIVHIRNDYIW